MEELHAAGFNAWGQLDFDSAKAGRGENVDDILEFTCILQGDAVSAVRAFLSHTTLKFNGATRTAGSCPQAHTDLCNQDPHAYFTLAEASNGSAATINKAGAVRQFKSLRDLLSDANPQGQIFRSLLPCTQLVAYDTGFAALTSAGSVYTWGDERYGACLGRDVTEENPADEPSHVTVLQDLPTGRIAKIAAGGYMLAALTTGNDLYLWGGHPGRKTVPADVTDEPTPVVIEDLDVADVAVGEAHLVVLTTDHRVFVIGDNGNGQLGLPVASTDSWREVELNLQKGSSIAGVAAGPRNSFIMIKRG